jgi:solute carrier family 24 (sodium/potassium/calcium exchanger), member 6
MLFTVAALAGLVLAAVVLALAKKGAHTAVRMTMCLIGFFVAIVWIMVIADEVVLVLQVRESVLSVSKQPMNIPYRLLATSLASQMRLLA